MPTVLVATFSLAQGSLTTSKTLEKTLRTTLSVSDQMNGLLLESAPVWVELRSLDESYNRYKVDFKADFDAGKRPAVKGYRKDGRRYTVQELKKFQCGIEGLSQLPIHVTVQFSGKSFDGLIGSVGYHDRYASGLTSLLDLDEINTVSVLYAGQTDYCIETNLDNAAFVENAIKNADKLFNNGNLPDARKAYSDIQTQLRLNYLKEERDYINAQISKIDGLLAAQKEANSESDTPNSESNTQQGTNSSSSDGKAGASTGSEGSTSTTSSNSSGNSANSSNANSTSSNNSGPDTTTVSKQQQQHQDQVARYQEIQKQTEQNAAAAASAGAAAGYAIFKIAQVIYSNLGVNSGDPFSGDAPSAKLQFGFGFTTVPIYENSLSSGSNSSGTLRAYATKTIDFNTRIELWPLQGNSYGIGLVGDFAGGFDLIFQNFKAEAQIGVQAYLGVDHWKAYAALYRGSRNHIYRPWILADEIGSGGTLKQRYSRVDLGGIFSWMAYYNGLTKAHLRLAALYEFPDLLYRSTPPLFLSEWVRGVHGSIYFENRIRYFADVFPKYPRRGEQDYAKGWEEISIYSLMLRLGASRCLDGNAPGSYTSKSRGATKESKSWFALYLSGNLTQLDRNRIDGKDALDNFMAGGGAGFSYERMFTEHFGIGTGISASLRSVGIDVFKYNTFVLDQYDDININLNQFKYSELSANLPIALVYRNTTSDNNIFWAKGGTKLNRPLRQRLFNAPIARYHNEKGRPFTKETEVEIAEKRSDFKSSFVSFGLDYRVNNSKTMRCGIELERDRSNALKSTISTHLVSARLLVGIIL